MDTDQERDRLQREIQQKDEQIAALQAQSAEVLRRLADLEGKHAKDSHNSHLPPSSDRFVRQPKSLRKKSGNRSGGQEGHPGTYLPMVSTPDQIMVHAPSTCSECQHDLSSHPVEQYCRRQVFDLPAPTILVCEHQA